MEKQAIGRVFRADSLLTLPEEDRNILVYRMASSTEDPEYAYTKDVELYQKSEIKQDEIDFVESVYASLAMNRRLTAYRNKPTPFEAQMRTTGSESSTSNRFSINSYDKMAVQRAMDQIKLLYVYNTILTPETAATALSIDPRLAWVALDEMISRSVIVRDRLGRWNLLTRTQGQEYFIRPNRLYVERTEPIGFLTKGDMFKEFKRFSLQHSTDTAREYEDAFLQSPIELKQAGVEALLMYSILPNVNHANRELALSLMGNSWFLLKSRNVAFHVLEELNADKAHYTANIDVVKKRGLLRILRYSDPEPIWGYVLDDKEEEALLDYANRARKSNKDGFGEENQLYGIVNTIDNLFRIKVPTDDSMKGSICMNGEKCEIISYLYELGVMPPGYSKSTPTTEQIETELTKSECKVEGSPRRRRFYFFWLKEPKKLAMCNALRWKLRDEGRLFFK
jgi:hypothetical protein